MPVGCFTSKPFHSPEQQPAGSCTHITRSAQQEKGQNLPHFKAAAHHGIPDYANHLGAFHLWSAAVKNPVLLLLMYSCFRKVFCAALNLKPEIPIVSNVPNMPSILSSRHCSMWNSKIRPCLEFPQWQYPWDQVMNQSLIAVDDTQTQIL